MSSMPSVSILTEIAAYKREWVAACKKRVPEQDVLEQAKGYTPLDFSGVLSERIGKKENAVIAEIKKASPSKGIICGNFDPVRIAKSYENGGATCLSILTDVKYFQGSDEYVRAIRQAVNIPILRKEFIVDPYQIAEARQMGADCILIILAMVDDSLAMELVTAAKELGISILPEVHNAEELDRALLLNTPLLGINNRNLHSFETTLQTTISLLDRIPDGKQVITESGIFSRDDIQLMNEQQVYGFLIGESLMRENDPGEALQQIMQP